MASTPLVANEVPNGVLAVFTFNADIDQTNNRIVVDRMEQGNTIDYTVTGTRQITFTAGSIPPPNALIWLFNGVAGVAIATSMANWATVAGIVSDAAIELGLVSTDIADPFVSTDTNVMQILRILRSSGRALVRIRDWTFLQREYTFQTVNGVNAYGLPSDYRSLISDSAWNRSSQFPVSGPLDGAKWQQLAAISSNSLVTMFFRIWLGQIYISPTPAAAQTVAFEYQSTSWIKPAGSLQPSSDAPSLASDIVCFDTNLIVARLKMDFRRNKKQDSASEQDDYENALYLAENEDSAGRTLYIGGGRNRPPRQIDRWNIPDVIR